MTDLATPLADADPLCRLTAEELRAGYQARTLSPLAVAHAALDRSEVVQDRFNASTLSRGSIDRGH